MRPYTFENRSSRGLGAFLAAGLIVLLTPVFAQAATRYAAPGGTGQAPCADRQNPCSLFVAADESQGASAGDEVVLTPGRYMDSKGDLGPQGSLLLAAGIEFHGEAGATRPTISLVQDRGNGGVIQQSGDTVKHIQIEDFAAVEPFIIAGGVAEDVISRSDAGPFTPACALLGGVLRDSACLSLGEHEIALGGPPSSGTAKARNVTAISTGPESFGIRYFVQPAGGPPPTFELDAKSVIAEGAGSDIAGIADRGSVVTISLDHSDYDSITPSTDGQPGSAVSITPLGSPTNIQEAPHLAADGIHELPDSPTIDKGALDSASGAHDIDGNSRQIEAAPDIGADEMTISTGTRVTCSPGVAAVGQQTICTATVANAASPVDPPRGEVQLSADGEPFDGEGCQLVALSGSSSSCKLGFETDTPGSYLIRAQYVGDGGHIASSSLAALAVVSPSGERPPRRPELGPERPPATLALKLPHKKERRGVFRFAFLSDQPGSFECKLDRSPFKACSSPRSVKVRPGAHVFRVRAVNLEGVADPTPVVARWLVLGP
jgi:hypothetical protein